MENTILSIPAFVKHLLDTINARKLDLTRLNRSAMIFVSAGSTLEAHILHNVPCSELDHRRVEIRHLHSKLLRKLSQELTGGLESGEFTCVRLCLVPPPNMSVLKQLTAEAVKALYLVRPTCAFKLFWSDRVDGDYHRVLDLREQYIAKPSPRETHRLSQRTLKCEQRLSTFAEFRDDRLRVGGALHLLVLQNASYADSVKCLFAVNGQVLEASGLGQNQTHLAYLHSLTTFVETIQKQTSWRLRQGAFRDCPYSARRNEPSVTGTRTLQNQVDARLTQPVRESVLVTLPLANSGKRPQNYTTFFAIADLEGPETLSAADSRLLSQSVFGAMCDLLSTLKLDTQHSVFLTDYESNKKTLYSKVVDQISGEVLMIESVLARHLDGKSGMKDLPANVQEPGEWEHKESLKNQILRKLIFCKNQKRV